jgi:uncharacterized membrane protein YesL
VRSLFGGLIIGLIWFVLTFYSYSLYLHKGFSLSFYILPFIILFIFTLNFFSITVHFQVKLFASLKHAILITIGSPLITLGITTLCRLLLFLSLKMVTFLIPFFVGSLIAYTSFLGFYSHLMKVELRKKSYSKVEISLKNSH